MRGELRQNFIDENNSKWIAGRHSQFISEKTAIGDSKNSIKQDENKTLSSCPVEGDYGAHNLKQSSLPSDNKSFCERAVAKHLSGETHFWTSQKFA